MGIIQKILAGTGQEFENIRRIAQKAANEVFRTNLQNMLWETDNDPKINDLCEEFRNALKKVGIEGISETNEELFIEIIRPLHLLQIERSA